MTDSEIELAAARVVAAKDRIDDERRVKGKRPVWPGAFVRYAFPFASGEMGTASNLVEAVPARMVLGAEWNAEWNSPPVGDEAERLCDHLDALATSKSEPNWAILVRVGDLPLWYAWEGKNRVKLYRSLDRPIIAEVRRSNHPNPSELVVRRGVGIAAVARASLRQALFPLPVPAVADLLVTAGAEVYKPLNEGDAQRLVAKAGKRALVLDIPY